MNAAQAESLISLIPFRALLTIARALGGVGADPHRLPGGKSGLADALIKRYGADAILAQWQKEDQATPPPQGTPAPHSHGHDDAPHDGPPPPEGSDTKGTAPHDATPGDAPQDGDMGKDAPAPTQGPQGDDAQQDESGDAPAPAPTQGEAPSTAAQGDDKGDKGEGDKAPAPEQEIGRAHV